VKQVGNSSREGSIYIYRLWSAKVTRSIHNTWVILGLVHLQPAVNDRKLIELSPNAAKWARPGAFLRSKGILEKTYLSQRFVRSVGAAARDHICCS
jgi:hypothetical protein